VLFLCCCSVFSFFFCSFSFDFAGRISESVIYFKESLKVVPDDPTTLVNMATSLYRLNKQNQAIVHYERASKYAQGFGQYFNWGYIHELRNEYDRAIQIFDMASQFMPEGGRMALYQDDPYAKAVCAIHLGTLLCRQHLSDQGLLAFYRAVAIDPSHQEAWMRMGLEHAVREGNFFWAHMYVCVDVDCLRVY
jgi:tetratricopeptide (TPR) repeat protein|tara:strand:- start:857 stop:1432 length:576 start_codon:yes stop_codon:yes gene_type:complete